MSEDSYEISLGNFDTETRRRSNLDQVLFWDEQAKKLSWFNQWTKTLEWNSPFAKWYIGGKINASYNTLDVHQTNRAKKPAIHWMGEDGKTRKYNCMDGSYSGTGKHSNREFGHHRKINCNSISLFDTERF